MNPFYSFVKTQNNYDLPPPEEKTFQPFENGESAIN